MISDPEVVGLITEFDYKPNRSTQGHQRHHDQTTTVQTAFIKDVHSLIETFDELGNLFLEESADLQVLDSKEIADQSFVNTVQNAKTVGQVFKGQFEALLREVNH